MEVCPLYSLFDAQPDLRPLRRRVPDLRVQPLPRRRRRGDPAGGIGVLGALYFTPDELEIELNWIDEHVDGKPYGVDLVMPASSAAKRVDDHGQADELRPSSRT